MTRSYNRNFWVTTLLLFFSGAIVESAHAWRRAHFSPAQEDALQRGLSALKDNHPEQALEALTAAEAEHPADARIRNFRGIALAQLGKTSQAAVEYQEALRLDPKYEDAYRNLGFLLWAEHDLTGARESLVRAVALSPEDHFAHYYLSRVQMDAGQYADAFREFKLSGSPWPSDPTFSIQAAAGYLALGETTEARQALNRLLSMPLSDTESAKVASLLLTAGEREQSIDLLSKASRRQPFEAYLWAQFDLVLANLRSGRHQEAAEQAQILVNLLGGTSPAPEESASAWSLLGIARARLGQGNQAVQALRRAALDDPSEDNWLNLTRELMEIRSYADAISVAKEAIGSKPASYALHLRLGAAQLAAGQYTEAESTFRALVEAGDPLPTSYVGLAQVLLREGRAQDAANELAAAKQRVGQSFLIEYFLGLSLDRAGKRTEAIAELREAIRLNPRSSEAYLALGKSELALRREKEAIADLEEALRLNPGHVQARRLLSQAYRKTGDLNNAAKYAEASNSKQPAPEGDLLGDFLLPGWQVPPEDAGNGSKLPKRSP